MATVRFLDALALILLLQLISSRPAEGKMIRKKPGIRTGDVLQTPPDIQPSEGAPWTSDNPPGPLESPPPRRSPGPSGSRPKRHVRDQPEEPECHLRSLLVRVKDLGLGYDSEESILFKYCAGRCPKARSNHAMTLALLLQKNGIPALGEPCCRPSRYEDVAFLDDGHQWHEVEQLSAASCGCVG
ncbi:persephin [Heteronotia binoei]|uniref:persephin n=1 Tax=Heteronotia binoei TaxID=13085 RepID=UPI0029302097|nr:persephin [Heteronotia binoei]